MIKSVFAATAALSVASAGAAVAGTSMLVREKPMLAGFGDDYTGDPVTDLHVGSTEGPIGESAAWPCSKVDPHCYREP